MSASTFIVCPARVKSLASQVPAAAPDALVTEAIETLTAAMWAGVALRLSKSPVSVWAGRPGVTGSNFAV